MAKNQNPWLGLKSYEESDRLYGRSKEADELANIVMNSFHTIIYGKSGIGKTSLLRAGVFPTLRYEDFMPIYIRLEHMENEAEEYYLRQIEEIVGGEHSHASSPDDVCCDNVCPSETHVRASLHNIFSSVKSSKSRGIELMPVFVFDQFEEIFTLNENHDSEAVNRFFCDLSDILNSESDGLNYRIVICLREDYLYYIERLSESIPAFKRNRYCLQDLTHEEALEVIKEPCPGMVDDAVAQEILRKLSPESAGEVNATILSLYMSQIYDKMVKSGDSVISSSLIRQFGDDIISAFYFSSIEGITERSIEYLEDHLITTGGYRHNVPLEDAVVAGVKQNELDRLKERRIITIQPKQGNVLYMEYAHDVLCPIIVSNREQRTLRKRTKRLRRIVAAWVVFFLFMIGIAAGIGWQAVQISRNNKELEATRDSLLTSNEAALREKQQKDIANDSLLQARLFLAMTNEDLVQINEQLKGEKDNVTRENKAMMLMQSRAIAGQAEKLRNEGQYTKAAALCLRALPKDLSNPDRPISSEALDELSELMYTDFAYYKKVLKTEGYTIYASFSPDNRYAVIASWRGTMIFDVETGCLVREFIGHSRTANCAKFSPDGKYIATASDDSTARIWSVATGKELKCMNHSNEVNSVSFSPDGKYVITTASKDSTAHIWNVATGNQAKILKGHESTVRKACFSPDGKHISTLSGETVIIWDAVTFKHKHILKPESIKTNTLSFSSDGHLLVTSASNKLFIWNVGTGEKVKEINIHQYAWGTLLSPDCRNLMVIGEDTTYILNASTGETERKLIYIKEKDGFNMINSAEYSPNGRYVIFTAFLAPTKILDLSSKRESFSIDLSGGHINPQAFSSDGKKLIVSYSCKSKSYQAISSKNNIDICDISTQEKIKRIETDTSVFNTSFSPDNKLIVAIEFWKGIPSVWNAETGEKVYSLDCKNARSAIFSPDGSYLTTASEDGTAKLWNAKTGALIRTFKGHTKGVSTATFSANGRYLVTASDDKTAKIWDVSTGRVVRTLIGHTREVTSASFSPDGHSILTSSLDGTGQIWDTNTGTKVKTFKGHGNQANYATYSPDGRYVILSYDVGHFSIWDAVSGICIRIFDKENSVAFTPDGRYLVTTSGKGTNLWRFHEPQELIDHFRKVVGDYQFTPEEETKYYLK